jgi:hypothetical protein
MKFLNLIFILVVFLKTETLFSKSNLFHVNNIQLEKNDKVTNKELSELAIKQGFDQLLERILLIKDRDRLSDLDFFSIKNLVTYYQIINISEEKDNNEILNFNILFDKNKIHDLFYEKEILYSEISDKEFYVLPILIKENEIFIFNNNFFYKNWNEIDENKLIEFILPLENIEIVKKINDNKENLLNLDINILFQEYVNKNLALILIEDSETSNEKIYINTIIQDKKISKSLDLKKQNLSSFEFYEKIITETKKELINLVKSNNLIDIRTPSFLNMRLKIYNKSNLVEIKKKMKKIQSIENIYVQEFNKDNMNLRIKYLGKLDKLINALKKENINLQLINDQWIIKTL